MNSQSRSIDAMPRPAAVQGHLGIGVNFSKLTARVDGAAERCWDVEDRDVVYLASATDSSDPWPDLFRGLGLTVFHGIDGLERHAGEEPPLVLTTSAAWRSHSGRARLTRLIREIPKLTVCVLTGLCPEQAASGAKPSPAYEDARAFLQAAGFGFFSMEYSTHAQF